MDKALRYPIIVALLCVVVSAQLLQTVVGSPPSSGVVAATPTFSPVAGTVASDATITMSSSSDSCSAKIYWNHTGSPTTGDTNSTTATVNNAFPTVFAKVIGCAGFSDSAVGSATYTFNPSWSVASAKGASSLSWATHKVGASNTTTGAIFLTVHWRTTNCASTVPTPSVTAASTTWNSGTPQAFTLVTQRCRGNTAAALAVALLVLVGPNTGTGTITVTMSGAVASTDWLYASATTFKGVDQATPTDGQSASADDTTGNGAQPCSGFSVTSSTSNDWGIAAAATATDITTATGSSQTEIFNRNTTDIPPNGTTSDFQLSFAGYKSFGAAPATITMIWNNGGGTSRLWECSLSAIKPSGTISVDPGT